jgi:glycosyltransferase involved in cell wall biosynthesis
VIPLVSVIIPARNEANYIEPCLESLLTGTYPRDRLEIIVCDGMSGDSTVAKVEAIAHQYPQVRWIPNPGRTAPAAMNAGIAAAKGEIIARADAHTLYAPDYLERCVELLTSRGADNVGGVQTATGEGAVGEAIARATSSRFAAGNALFRYASHEAWVETVYLGCWRKETLLRLGGFDERFVVNQDYELNHRLRQAGGKILLSPTIRCRYFVRPSLAKLARQYYRYGLWKTLTLRVHPTSLRARQLAAPIFVAALAGSITLALFGSPGPLALLTAAYASAALTFSWAASRPRHLRLVPLVALAFLVIHVSWGSGFLLGLALRNRLLSPGIPS